MIWLLWFLVFGIAYAMEKEESWAEKTLQRLTLREKIGQLFVVAATTSRADSQEVYRMDQPYIDTLITQYGIGGLIFLLKNTPSKQIASTNRFQKLARVPLLIMQDAEWGLSMRHDDVVRYPKNMTLGAIQDNHLLYQFGKEVGKQCAALGIHMNAAPVIDINSNSKNPVIGDRSLGEDPYDVAAKSFFIMKGMQYSGVRTCAKHFPGHGDTAVDSHLDLPLVKNTKEELAARELVPFGILIKAGIDAVMSAHIHLPAYNVRVEPSSMSKVVVTDLLKDEMGFKGIAMTDGLGMKAVTRYAGPGLAEYAAYLAGNDIILCPLDIPKAVDAIEYHVKENYQRRQDLDSRVLKILKLKQQCMLNQQKYSIKEQDALRILHTPEAYELKQKLYRAAVTLVRNKNNLLPLPQEDSSLGLIQVGAKKPYTFLQKLGRLSTGQISWIMPGLNIEDRKAIVRSLADVKTVVIGLADMNTRNSFYGLPHELFQVITDLKKKKKNIVLVLFGSPYALRLCDKEDAIIVAYEDDDDAQTAAADVIIGNLRPKGKLPVSGSSHFPCGLGLTC